MLVGIIRCLVRVARNPCARRTFHTRRAQAAPGSQPRPSRAQAGFSMLEALIGAILLTLGLMGYAAATISHHELSKEQRARSEALQVVRQFVERLRSDEDWAGIYARLHTLRVAAATVSNSTPTLANGLRAYTPQTYFSDFAVPREPVNVLVDVPASPPPGGGPLILREDVSEPRFGLPGDLNGDGLVNATAHDANYRALPVFITFQWKAAGRATRELTVATWLRGER